MFTDHLRIASGSELGFGRGEQIYFPAATPGRVLTTRSSFRSVVDVNVVLGARLLALEAWFLIFPHV